MLGSDIYITSQFSPKNFIDENAIIRFIQENKGAITSYGFVTSEFTDVVNLINSGNRPKMYIGSASGFNQAQFRLYGMQENYL